MTSTLTTWLPLAPLVCLLMGGMVLMLVDAFIKEQPEPALIAAGTLIVSAVISGVLWMQGAPNQLPAYLGDYLALTELSLFFDIVICSGTAMAALLAGGYLNEHRLERGEFYVVLLFSAFGAMVLARATDLLSIFLGLETMSLGIYTLVAFRRGSPRAIEGGLKYFLLGSFASALFLFGSALLYGATGHTQLHKIGVVIASGESESVLLIMALLLVVTGMAFKVSAVPFHMWTPDAYEGAATPATTFMSVVAKTATFALMIRMLFVCFGDELSGSMDTGWPPLLAGLAAVTMIYGNLAAVVQSSVKRMLAYSSIAHAGFIMVGIVAAWKLQQPVSGALFYLMAYTVSNVLAFGSLILMGSRGKEAVSYEDLAGVGLRHPLAAIPFVLAMLSLMGMPPTAGFFAKYYVLESAVRAGDGMVWLALIGALSSAVGAFYYLRVVVYMFMKEPEPGAPLAVPMRSGYVAAVLLICAFYVLHIGIAPGEYLELVSKAADTIV